MVVVVCENMKETNVSDLLPNWDTGALPHPGGPSRIVLVTSFFSEHLTRCVSSSSRACVENPADTWAFFAMGCALA